MTSIGAPKPVFPASKLCYIFMLLLDRSRASDSMSKLGFRFPPPTKPSVALLIRKCAYAGAEGGFKSSPILNQSNISSLWRFALSASRTVSCPIRPPEWPQALIDYSVSWGPLLLDLLIIFWCFSWNLVGSEMTQAYPECRITPSTTNHRHKPQVSRPSDNASIVSHASDPIEPYPILS